MSKVGGTEIFIAI